MSRLWLPAPTAEFLDHRRALDAERDALSAHMRDVLPETRRYNEDLKRIDPLLELVFVGDGAPADDPAVMPGRWHVVRRNPTAADAWMALHADGAYVDPRDVMSAIYQRLAETDMWNGSHLRRQRQREATAAAARERRKADAVEARRQELNDRVLAATRTQVSTTTARPWTQNAQPAALREAGNRAAQVKACR